MTEQGRILAIKERSCGLQSPPVEFKPKNHGGFGIISASSYGNPASSWDASPQSPPQVIRYSVVTTLWNT